MGHPAHFRPVGPLFRSSLVHDRRHLRVDVTLVELQDRHLLLMHASFAEDLQLLSERVPARNRVLPDAMWWKNGMTGGWSLTALAIETTATAARALVAL
jgi:hypothetical protein